jgi:hypothetical protein
VRAQPWQERRREYLERKGRLDNLITMPAPHRSEAETLCLHVSEALEYYNGLSEAPRRGISGAVATVGRPREIGATA